MAGCTPSLRASRTFTSRCRYVGIAPARFSRGERADDLLSVVESRVSQRCIAAIIGSKNYVHIVARLRKTRLATREASPANSDRPQLPAEPLVSCDREITTLLRHPRSSRKMQN